MIKTLIEDERAEVKIPAANLTNKINRLLIILCYETVKHATPTAIF